MGEWHGHVLLLDRRQCVLLCHDLTRYVLFLAGFLAAHWRGFRPLASGAVSRRVYSPILFDSPGVRHGICAEDVGQER